MVHIAVPPSYQYVDYAQQTVGGTEAVLTAPTRKNGNVTARPTAIMVQAEPANSGKITIGVTGLSAGGAGITLSATSAPIFLPTTAYGSIYIIGSAAGQKLNIVYCYGAQ